MRHLVRWLCGALVALSAASLPASDTLAAGPDASRGNKSVQDEARDRLEHGVQAFVKGHYKEAIDSFLVANRLVPSPSLSFNIARAYVKLDDDPSALMWYRDYLRQAPGAEDRDDVQKRIHALELKLQARGVQQVTVLSVPNAATVEIDGQPMGVTPWTGELPPRKHTIVLRRPGYQDATRDLVLTETRSMDVAMALEETGATPAPQSTSPAPVGAAPAAGADSRAAPWTAPPPAASPRHVSTATWVTLGAGGALLIGALGFEFARRSAETDVDGEPTQLGAHDKYETMRSRQTAARVLVGVGAAATAAGGLLLWFDLHRSERAEPARSATAHRVGLGCAGAGCGFFATGNF